MFGLPDEDDFEFSPAAGSKLASLFNLEKPLSKGNTSLTYTAPKQPKPRSAVEDNLQTHGGIFPNKLSLILVKEVHSFKLENGNYNAHGKSGAALVGNDASRIFRLLLYKGKQQIYTSATIGPTFQYTVLPNLYASFYDNGMQNWSINFESKEDFMDFARQVGVARFKAFKLNEEVPLFQDLYPGSEKGLKVGDIANLSLTASYLQSGKAEMKASLEQKLSDVGWSTGLIGASPGSHRLLILPQSVEVPWIYVKKGSTMLIEALVENKQDDQSSTTVSSLYLNEPKQSVQVPGAGDSAADSGCEDSSIRARGASIKEALTHSPRSSKASIISRMARMGQATLPLEGAAVCLPSDSEETEEESGAQESKRPPLKTRPNKLRSSTTAAHQHMPSSLISSSSNMPSHISSASPSFAPTMTIVQAPSSLHRAGTDGSVIQYLTSEGQIVSLNAPSASVSPSDPAPHISMFLSEARMHNTEMRMHFNKFGDKMDQLITKVDTLQQQTSATRVTSPVAVAGLEPSTLLSSIEKLVTDNQTLQAEVAEKNKRLDEQNERIFSLLSANSRFLEQSSSFFEQKQQQLKQDNQQQQTEELSALVQQMQGERVVLTNKISSLQTQLVNVQGLVQSLQKCNKDLTQEVEKCQVQLKEKETEEGDRLIDSNSGLVEEINSLSRTLQDKTQLVADLQQQIEINREKYSAELKNLHERCESMEQQHLEKISTLNNQLKEECATSSRLAASANKLEIQCTELKKQLDSSKLPAQVNTEAPSVSLSEFTSEVKSLMNTLYRGLSQQFVPGQSYDGGFVKSSIASIIKGETLNFVELLETRYSDPISDHAQLLSALVKDNQQTVAKSIEKGKIRDQDVVGTAEAKINDHSINKSDPDFNYTLDSSSTSAVSSTEPDLPPIPQATATHSLTSNSSSVHSSSRQEEREPSPVGSWGQRPPPLPLFNDEDEDSDDWVP